MNGRTVRLSMVLCVLIVVVVGSAVPTAARGWPATGAARSVVFPREDESSPGPGEVFEAGALLVKFESGVPGDTVAGTMERYRATRVRYLYNSPVELWRVPEGTELEVVEQLNADPNVVYAEPNYVWSTFVEPNDPHYDKQWAHTVMQSEAGWDIDTGTPTVVIAIIDTGIDETHPDLAGKIVPGYDFSAGDADPHDTNGHGTHCAGIAAAATDNGVGVAGLDWHASIMPVRVLGRRGSGYISDVAAGILWAHDNGADVVSMSFGGAFYSQTIKDVVDVVYEGGTMLVAAMGNWREYDNPKMYPAGLPKVMAVAATGPTDVYAPYSQFGPHCDIAAPGGDMEDYGDPDGIYSTLPTYPVYLTTDYHFNTYYDFLDGTSMATPYVAGLAALVRGVDPSLTPAQVQEVIENTADDLGPVGWDENYGWGRINVLAALQEITPPGVPALLPIDNPENSGDYLVDWEDAVNAASYTLEEDDNPGFGSPTVRYSGADSEFLVAGQTCGTWYYRVRASNHIGDSAWSDSQSTLVLPAVPGLFPIDNPELDGDYVVDWEDVPEATSYTLEEDDNPAFSSPAVRYDGGNSQFAVTSQQPGLWYYRVRSGNAVGHSEWSQTESTGVLPAAPVLSSIVNPAHADEYDVVWSSLAGATNYLLQEAADPSFVTPTIRYAGPLSQYGVTGQAEGDWYYRVRAYSRAGAGPWSDTQSTVVDPAPLGAPSLLPINNADGDGEYLVEWTEVTSATAYALEESSSRFFAQTTVVYSGTNPYVTMTDKPVARLHYRVRAYGPAGRGPWSNRQCVCVGSWIFLPLVAKQTVFSPAARFSYK